jgi:hypothetical protein
LTADLALAFAHQIDLRGLVPETGICQRAAKAADCSNGDYDSVMIGCTPVLFLLRF